jgi:hypothetical protein
MLSRYIDLGSYFSNCYSFYNVHKSREVREIRRSPRPTMTAHNFKLDSI